MYKKGEKEYSCRGYVDESKGYTCKKLLNKTSKGLIVLCTLLISIIVAFKNTYGFSDDQKYLNDILKSLMPFHFHRHFKVVLISVGALLCHMLLCDLRKGAQPPGASAFPSETWGDTCPAPPRAGDKVAGNAKMPCKREVWCLCCSAWNAVCSRY